MSNIVWKPNHPELTQMWQFMRFIEQKYDLIFENYHQLHEWSIHHPERFWQNLYEFFSFSFDTPPHEILHPFDEMINAHWFTGARFNFAEKLLSKNDDYPALISIDENNYRQVFSYRQLRKEVAECAAGLKSRGIKEGDRVVAVLPNIAATVIAMLATASLGAIWSSCSPDFGAQAIIDRLGQIEPKLLFICDGHQYQGKIHSATEKIKQIAEAIPSLKDIVLIPFVGEKILGKLSSSIVEWKDFKKTSSSLKFTSLPFNHPLYILYSSGTTGKPKCIIHGAGGTLLQHMKELGLHTDIKEGDNLCFYTTCGWMMWNWMVSVLSLGATLTLYEGSPTFPDAGRMFQLIEDEQITVFGTSAKFISAIEKTGIRPKDKYRLDGLRCILSTGSPLLPKNYDYVYQQLKPEVQLCSISGGTDIISCFALGNPILPVYRGELQCAGLGMAVEVFDEQGRSVRQTHGELVCTKPFPSMPVGFWNDPDQSRYKKAYFARFPNVWAHGDFAEITKHHGLIIHGRSDSVLNPGGVRIGTAEIYRQIEKIPQVLDSVVVGQNWEDDVRVVLFVKLKEGIELSDELITTIRQTIRTHASPRHVPAKILQVKDIPRTISGKTVEVAVRKIIHGESIENVESLANPEALEYFKNRDELRT
ncbi:acetoacetate--CoA ligase [Legionella israelensis]|uniref:acetoacetate--CoA ligase n=1 Tax=Legionella israelensis TaxID=454 RepID=UPI00117E26E2|nr:acetoacetate--CoA ligase [Legionella israelensis]QDP73109.1 acetoacetate--CoA ligase [Legionella israelensis]